MRTSPVLLLQAYLALLLRGGKGSTFLLALFSFCRIFPLHLYSASEVFTWDLFHLFGACGCPVVSSALIHLYHSAHFRKGTGCLIVRVSPAWKLQFGIIRSSLLLEQVFNYEKVQEKKSWIVAQLFCQELKAQLLSLDSYEEEHFVANTLNKIFGWGASLKNHGWAVILDARLWVFMLIHTHQCLLVPQLATLLLPTMYWVGESPFPSSHFGTNPYLACSVSHHCI